MFCFFQTPWSVFSKLPPYREQKRWEISFSSYHLSGQLSFLNFFPFMLLLPYFPLPVVDSGPVIFCTETCSLSLSRACLWTSAGFSSLGIPLWPLSLFNFLSFDLVSPCIYVLCCPSISSTTQFWMDGSSWSPNSSTHKRKWCIYRSLTLQPKLSKNLLLFYSQLCFLKSTLSLSCVQNPNKIILTHSHQSISVTLL